jgi:Protein of unknown function (DUF2934)
MITTSTPLGGWQIATEQAELQKRIQSRAYDLYEQRGREDGWDLDDWLRAESELTQRVLASCFRLSW